MTLEARMIVTNAPSKGNLGGVVVYRDGNPIRVAVNQRFLNDHGKLGVKRAIDGDLDGVEVDFNHTLSEKTKGTFNAIFRQFCEKMQFDSILPYDELHIA